MMALVQDWTRQIRAELNLLRDKKQINLVLGFRRAKSIYGNINHLYSVEH